MTTFISSDLHLNHRGKSGRAILDYTSRGRNGELFTTVDEMNLAILQNWNSVVGHDDEVFIVGDIAMGNRKETLLLVELLHGKKYLVPGNHDHVHPMYSFEPKYDQWVSMYEGAGLWLLPAELYCAYTPGLELTVGEALGDIEDMVSEQTTVFRMCHFPYDGDSREDTERYPEWRPDNDGMLLLHGHTHSQVAYRDIQCDVGCDAWDCSPQTLDQILSGFTTKGKQFASV